MEKIKGVKVEAALNEKVIFARMFEVVLGRK